MPKRSSTSASRASGADAVKVVVTGSAGKIGRSALVALRSAGHRVLGLDIAGPIEPGRQLRCDCTDFGAVMGALSGIDPAGGIPDAVVHLAGIPAPGLATDEATFAVNMRSTYNIFSACARLGIRKIAWASSETILGLPFDEPPAFAPLDETHPDRPNWSYALAKQLGETMADNFVRWHPDMAILSLRFSNVFTADDYAGLAKMQADPARRKWNLWSYVDAEDAAQACVDAVEARVEGHHRLIVAAADTLFDRPSAELMAEYFPGVPLGPVEGFASLQSSARAQEIIGYRPQHSWRQRVPS
jgi:nucleoside-diphosphate-sugar epimerase